MGSRGSSPRRKKKEATKLPLIIYALKGAETAALSSPHHCSACGSKSPGNFRASLTLSVLRSCIQLARKWYSVCQP